MQLDSKVGSERGKSVPKIIVFTGVLLSFALAALVYSLSSTETDRRWRLLATDHISLFERQLDRSIGWVDATHGLYKASNNVTLDEFNEFVAALGVDDRLQGVSWVPRVHDRDLAPYLAEMKSAYDGDFLLKGVNGDGIVGPRGTADVYFPVSYIFPTDRNKAAVGFDIGSNADRRVAIDKAIAQNAKSVTAPIQLVQSTVKQFGFLIIQPFVRPSKNGQTAGVLEGLITAVFNVDNLVKSISDARVANFTIDIHDVSNADNPIRMFPAEGGQEIAGTNGLSYGRDIAVADRLWRIVMSRSTETIDYMRYLPAVLALLLGLAGTAYFALQARYAGRKTQEAAWHKARQEELEHANEEAEYQRKLQESGVVKLKAANDRANAKNAELQTLTANLSRFLPRDLYEKVFESPQQANVLGERKILSVLFVDLVGFSSFADKSSEGQVVDMLNLFFSEMTDIAGKYRGSINKFTGDGLFVVFGDLYSEGEQVDALRCVRCAVAMRRQLLKRAREFEDDADYNPVQCHIGIATGDCIVGNFGSDARLDYTVVSSTVNLASRLEKAAGADEIVISDRTYQMVSNAFHATSIDDVELRGFNAPVKAWMLGKAKPKSKPKT